MGKNILLQVDGEWLDNNQMEGIIDYRVDIDKAVMNHPKYFKSIVTTKVEIYEYDGNTNTK